MASTEAKKLRRKKTRRGREQENGSSRSPDASHSDLTNGSPGGASQRTVLSFTKITDSLEGGLQKQNCSESNPLARNTPNEEHHQLRTGNFQNGSDENCCCESNKPVDPPDIYVSNLIFLLNLNSATVGVVIIKLFVKPCRSS